METPFLAEELFADEIAGTWDTHLAALEVQSAFQNAFDDLPDSPIEAQLFQEEAGWEDQSASSETLPGVGEGETVYGSQPPFAEEYETHDEGDDENSSEEVQRSEVQELGQEEFDVPSNVSKGITDALVKKDWGRALELAIQAGRRDENDLTNLIFFAGHPELAGRKLDPARNKEDKRLVEEWVHILTNTVRPAIWRAVENTKLKVSGRYVAERDSQFSGDTGKKFRELVEWSAREVGINPGLLAAALLAESDQRSVYLSSGEVRSFLSGTDDFFELRKQIRANVPAVLKVHFDESKKSTDINEQGRVVTTIPFNSGKDAALATAVYLKYGEIKLRKAAERNGGDFDKLPVETRLALVRISMTAGHGGIGLDGELKRYKKRANKEGRRVWVLVKGGEIGGVRIGVAARLESVLKGVDILVRKHEPRKYPSTPRITNRNATILVAQAMHLSDWVFGIPLALGVQPELEDFKDTKDSNEDVHQDNSNPGVYTTSNDAEYGGVDRDFLETTVEEEELAIETFEDAEDEEYEESDVQIEMREDEASGSIESRELDPVVLDFTETIMARESPPFEPELSKRWTRCFAASDIARVEKVYHDNASAASANSLDRCSCIVMLNVALGQLLSLPLRANIAHGATRDRPASSRTLQMGKLSTKTIELAMAQLRKSGFGAAPIVLNFLDRRNRTAGTLKPERLRASVQAKVLAVSETEGCWFAFGLSIMDGYHSVLLLVDRSAAEAKIYWLDQYSSGVGDDVTASLDTRITERTQTWWQYVMNRRGRGYRTTIRVFPLRKRM